VNAPTVIFQLTAIGKNPGAIEESARSVLYWVRRTPRLAYRYLIWAVIEREGYRTSPRVYESLERAGVEVIVVPDSYATALGTEGKARALEFATELRRRRGLAGEDVWVYHQDEETCVGQDTLLGISQFVRDGRWSVGTGVILYPIDWSGSPSHVQEVTRSFDDFRVLDSMTLPGNPTTGFHGSHFLVRSDIEDTVGWDAHGYTPAEDLLFELRVRARFGAVFGVLRGFAYEKGAFSLKDQIQQRRRWVHGVLHALRPRSELPRERRLAVAYGALSWFSALPSVAVLVASAWLRYGPILIVTGVFTGFIWVSMVLAYVEGYRMHRAYLERPIGALRFVAAGMLGALVDVTAPWYALLTRPSRSDFIPKDPAAHPAAHRRTARSLPSPRPAGATPAPPPAAGA
jgi:egghead protein (zeste-white 4 protein)